MSAAYFLIRPLPFMHCIPTSLQNHLSCAGGPLASTGWLCSQFQFHRPSSSTALELYFEIFYSYTFISLSLKELILNLIYALILLPTYTYLYDTRQHASDRFWLISRFLSKGCFTRLRYCLPSFWW